MLQVLEHTAGVLVPSPPSNPRDSGEWEVCRCCGSLRGLMTPCRRVSGGKKMQQLLRHAAGVLSPLVLQSLRRDGTPEGGG